MHDGWRYFQRKKMHKNAVVVTPSLTAVIQKCVDTGMLRCLEGMRYKNASRFQENFGLRFCIWGLIDKFSTFTSIFTSALQIHSLKTLSRPNP